MFTKRFWIDAFERSIKTVAQFLLTTGALDPLSTDFQTSLQTKAIGALMAGFVSILTSLVSTSFGQKDSASMIDTPGDDGFAMNDTLVFVTGILIGALITKVFLC